MSQGPGRRERKRAQTRQALADVALDLFLDRGYDAVGVREIADAADISTTTLFKYFPSKEALVFDLDQETEHDLVGSVRDRPAGQTVIGALRTHAVGRVQALLDEPRTAQFWAMVTATAPLHDYCRRMWLRHEDLLTAAIIDTSEAKGSEAPCRVLAHLALESVADAMSQPDPIKSVRTTFDLLERGWQSISASSRTTAPDQSSFPAAGGASP